MIFFSLRGRFSSQCFFGSISSSLPTPHLFLMWTLWKWLKYEKVTYKAVFESEISSTKITLEIICFKGIFPKLFAPFSSSHGMGNLGSTTSFFLKKGDFVVFFSSEQFLKLERFGSSSWINLFLIYLNTVWSWYSVSERQMWKGYLVSWGANILRASKLGDSQTASVSVLEQFWVKSEQEQE